MVCHAGYLQHVWCLEISNRKLTPGLRWPVLTRKSTAGFARELTDWTIQRIREAIVVSWSLPRESRRTLLEQVASRID